MKRGSKYRYWNEGNYPHEWKTVTFLGLNSQGDAVLEDPNGHVWRTNAVSMFELCDEQPDPQPNDNPPVWDLVMNDMKERDNLGRARYGTPLQAHNGRDALLDAYQEALDLCVYLRQALFERDGK